MLQYNTVTLEETESTNAYALEFMHSFEDKTVIAAKKQTAGRGRYSRKWVSGSASDLYMTIVLKPASNNYPFQNLTQYLSVIVSRVLENDYNIKASIKWPNDILVKGAKISGILAETLNKNSRIEGIALGLGVNTNLEKEVLDKIDQKAVSMAQLLNKEIDTEELIHKICRAFFDDYDEFIQKGFLFIKDEYVKRCRFLGGNITIREENKQYLAENIDNDGLLTVKDEFGKKHKIITGDILCAV